MASLFKARPAVKQNSTALLVHLMLFSTTSLAGDLSERPSAPGPFDLVPCNGSVAGGLANQNVQVPVDGTLLFGMQGNTCAILPNIPSFLNPGPKKFGIQIFGSRDSQGVPAATSALVSVNGTLGSGAAPTRLQFPTASDSFVAGTSPDGLTFTVSGTSLALLLPSSTVTIPLSNPSAPIVTPTGRRLQSAIPRVLGGAVLPLRLQQQANAEYTLTLEAFRCTNAEPVLDASNVQASLAYFSGAVSANISLSQSAPNSNSYTGTVNLDTTLGNNFTYAVEVSVNFCEAVQGTISSVCSTAQASNTAAVTTLLESCKIFLNGGLTSSTTPVATQITKACSLIALSLETLCTAPGALQCTAVSQKNFNVVVTGIAQIPGVKTDPFTGNPGPSLYQGTVNGVAGNQAIVTLVVPEEQGG
ncbi:hypothetical protein WJX73_004709 [Symbiochloris irregularis]|uniref:Uncharacterized protein n=1 Tax=Symbiochloris irregularis TaxID=706552 RepID=A0AAW1PG96_9CHLO